MSDGGGDPAAPGEDPALDSRSDAVARSSFGTRRASTPEERAANAVSALVRRCASCDEPVYPAEPGCRRCGAAAGGDPVLAATARAADELAEKLVRAAASTRRALTGLATSLRRHRPKR